MIKLTKVNKFFNKKKNNEIHVLNNIDLSLGSVGLVALFGESGSGKTTLLNVIGGLDGIENGNIEIDDKKIGKYNFNKIDAIRNREIGYIFQNYNLLSNLTIAENIEMSLKIAGEFNKQEIDKRVDYSLEIVGLKKYRNRKPQALSGGQRQRVAIARALSKHPKIIIADEPTGNLDEKNTTITMDILKQISKFCLVVLVSHERHLVEYYADRIIEIKDGKIIGDKDNSSKGQNKKVNDVDIYLKDYEKKNLKIDNLNVDLFTDGKSKNTDIKLVYKDGILFVKIDGENLTQINYLDEKSEVKLLDKSHKEVVEANENQVDVNFDIFKEIENPIKKSPFSFFQTLKMTRRRQQNNSKGKKAITKLFMLLSFAFVIAVSGIAQTYHLPEEDFLRFNRNIVDISVTNTDVREFVKNFKEDENNFLMPQYNTRFSDGRFEMNIAKPHFKQFSTGYETLHIAGSLIKWDILKEKDILEGKLEKNINNVILSSYIADNLVKDGKRNGFYSYKYIIGQDFTIQSFGEKPEIYKVVAIAKCDSPTVFVAEDVIFSQVGLTINFAYHSIGSDTMEGLKINPGEVDVGALDIPDNALIDGKRLKIQGKEYTVVRNRDGSQFNTKLLFNIEDLKEIALTSKNLSLYTNNKKQYLDKSTENIEYSDRYSSTKEMELEYRKPIKITIFTLSIVLLIGGIVSVYFLMRSNLFSRIKEIGIYRAIGTTRRDLYKMFSIEIIYLLFTTSLIGLILGGVFVNFINVLGALLYFPFWLGILVFFGVLTINLFFGLLPLILLLRKTPSEIIAKYDI